ncbi:MAG: hypothetical protein ISS66_09170 [Desulfobacteraceae bacterium]|nr:hypothetical protein [Desulfobacteraceae bacterium]
MFAYSTLLRPLFWMVMGLIYALMIAGAPAWAQDLGLKMTWWKWLLAALWYFILSVGLAGGFTLLGEKEPRAGYYSLGLVLIVMIILGVGLWFLLWAV